MKIIEVMPINFLLKEQEEQEAVIYDFEKFLRVAPPVIHIKSIAKRTDINRYLKKLDNEIATEENENCRKLLEDSKKLIYNIGAMETVSRRFFMVIEYKKKGGRIESDADIENQLCVLRDRASNYLRECGNSVLVMENNTEETAKILFDIFNRNLNSSVDFPKRVQHVYAHYAINYGEKATKMIPITEYFAPEKIDFTHSNYTGMNNNYYSFSFIKSDGYPSVVPHGWVSMMVNAGEGIDFDMYWVKERREVYAERIGRHLRWNSSKMREMSDSTTEYDDVSDALSAGYYLKNGISNNQDFHYLSIMVTCVAEDPKVLQSKSREMEVYLKSHEIHMGNCNYEQKRALLSYMPLGRMDPKIFRRSKRNILTCDLAACYPFTSYEMCDEDGILLGTNEMNNSLSMVDFFNTKVYKNANIAILGTTGAGKTYLLQLIAKRFREKKIQTFIIAPDKGHEFKRACDRIGGQFIQISAASNQCINVMEIRKQDTEANRRLDGELTQSKLASKIQSLHIFFGLLVPDIKGEEDQLVDEALLMVYKKYGITNDNNTLFDPERPGEYKTMPVLGDVYDELIKREGAKRIATILNRLVHGSASSFNQQTNVELDNLYTVVDISNLTGPLLTLGMFIAVDYIYSKAKENRTKRKAIIIDEMWELIGSKSNNKAAEYVLEIFKIIRGYGGSAISATQNLNDYFALEDGKYGKGVINNCKTKIILNLEKEDAKMVQDILGLSEEEYKKILRFPRGHGLLSTNGNNVPIEFKASKLENALITTDRKQLEKLAENDFWHNGNKEEEV